MMASRPTSLPAKVGSACTREELLSTGLIFWTAIRPWTKQAKTGEIDAGNRTSTMDQLSSKLFDVGLNIDILKLHNWLKVMNGGIKGPAKHNPSLSPDHKNRVDLILDLVSRDRKPSRLTLTQSRWTRTGCT